jgi:uncharacterized protein YkwD
MHRLHLRLFALMALAAVPPTGCGPEGLFGLPSPHAAARALADEGASAGEAASAPATRPLFSAAEPPDAAALIDAMLEAVNSERGKMGLPRLVLSDDLTVMADHYADRLIAGDYFAHIDPLTGSTLAARARQRGYSFYKVGENLAAGQPDVAAAMADWMKSPTHRANILDPDFTELGIAVRDGGRYGRYWVQEFGRPLGQ